MTRDGDSVHRAAEADVDGDARRADGARRGPVGLLLPPAPAAAAPVRVKVARETLLPSLPQKTVDGARELIGVRRRPRLPGTAGRPVTCRSPTAAAPGQRRLRTQDYPSYLPRPVREQVLFDGVRRRPARRRRARAARRAAVARHRPRRRLGRARRAGRAPRRCPGGGPQRPRLVRGAGPVPLSRHERPARRLTTCRGSVGRRVLQTWHGVPVTSVGLDDEHAGTRLGRGWEERLRAESARWDVVLSAGPHGREVLQRAFALGDAVRETGLPRHDLLVSPDLAAEREKRAAAVRDELGIPAGRRIVLLAPTYRPGTAGRTGPLPPRPVPRPGTARRVARRRPRAAGARAPQGRRHRPAGRRPHGVRRVLARRRSRPAARRRRAGDRLLVGARRLRADRAPDGVLHPGPRALPGPSRPALPRARRDARCRSSPTSRTSHRAVLDADRHTDRYADAYRDLVQTYAPVSDGRAAARAVDLLLGEGS